MLLDVAGMAVLLAIGNVVFRHFDPWMTWWQRLLKATLILVITGIISHYFGRKGVVITFSLFVIPLVYVHAIWLPRHGVNGWTAEPREKYYKLRGRLPPKP